MLVRLKGNLALNRSLLFFASCFQHEPLKKILRKNIRLFFSETGFNTLVLSSRKRSFAETRVENKVDETKILLS